MLDHFIEFMADPYPEYDPAQYETVPPPATTPTPILLATTAPMKKSMGSVEIGVIAIALAVGILAMSVAIAVSKR